jgi:hypothetical protein
MSAAAGDASKVPDIEFRSDVSVGICDHCGGLIPPGTENILNPFPYYNADSLLVMHPNCVTEYMDTLKVARARD